MAQQEAVNSVKLINISLVHHDTSRNSDTQLGAVVIPSQEWESMCLPALRNFMKQQLPQLLPASFNFLSAQRFKVHTAQEGSVKAFQICEPVTSILYIQHNHDLPQLSLINADGTQLLGFIYTALDTNLRDIRGSVKSKCVDHGGMPRPFNFVWPDGPRIFPSEETTTQVHEILLRNQIYIKISDGVVTEDSCDSSTAEKRKIIEAFDDNKRKSIRLSFSSNKDLVRMTSHNGALPTVRSLGASKQLLISYVRAEAANHALMLKQSLTRIGFSVYLDVDEIKSGLDWQDALNYAVSNCEIFIPLVTPRYGETQWTNREVKLADVLGKSILPVSFLEDWPPRCLAIQFATTQYICWKSEEQITEELLAGQEDARDIRVWNDGCVDAVAKEIETRLKNQRTGGSSMSKPALRRIKTLLKTFAGRLPASATPVLANQENDETPGYTIVICAHYEDASLGFKVKSWLETTGHSVWISCVKALCPDSDETDSHTLFRKMTEMDIDCNTFKTSWKSGTKLKQLQEEFQEVVDKASLVVILLSQSSAFSKLFEQQVFYCEHRKQILPVLYGDFDLPGWLKMFIKTQKCLRVNSNAFYESLQNRVKRALDPTAKGCLDLDNNEANIMLAMQYLKKNLDVEHCVYVSGSSLHEDPRADAICRSIGRELAKQGNIHIVSSGSYGTSTVLSQVFSEMSLELSGESKLWHVLPERDTKDKSKLYNQCADGTFALKEYGKTLFCGNSVWERESIVGRCFRVCLLVVGGTYSTHEVAEFVWSDRIVVPVNGPFVSVGADSKATARLHRLPPGVEESDWKCLNDPVMEPEDIGPAAARVLSGLLLHFRTQGLNTQHPSELSTPVWSDPPPTPNSGHLLIPKKFSPHIDSDVSSASTSQTDQS